MIYSYRRVSTDEQSLGPQAQSHAIDRWSEQHNHNKDLWGHFFDDGVSGAVPLAEREQGARLLAALQPGDVVVTYKLDRLFRSVADAAMTIDKWVKAGVKLVSLQEGFDLTSPYGVCMAHVMSAMAELERAMIRQRTKAALDAKKAQGTKLGHPFYGWRIVNGVTVRDEHEQKILREIKSCHDAGLRQPRIAARLNEAGIPTRHGRRWTAQSIWKILTRLDRRGIIL